MVLFKKNKNIKAQNKEAKSITSKNREGAEDIKARLEAVGFFSTEGEISGETKKVFESCIRVLILRLENARAIASFDAGAIDAMIKKYIHLLQKALTKGDLETAKRAVKGLNYGIVTARSEFAQEEMEEKEEQLEKRQQHMDEYWVLISLSEKVFDAGKNIGRKEVEIEDAADKYRQQYEEVNRQIKSRPDLYEHLSAYRPGIDTLMPEAKELDTQMALLRQEKSRLDGLKQEKATYDNQKNEYTHQLKNQEDHLSSLETATSQRMRDILRQSNERQAELLLNIERETRELEEIGENYYNSLNAIYSSAEMGGSVMKHLREFEEIRRLEEEREAGIARGHQNMQEQEADFHENGRILSQ